MADVSDYDELVQRVKTLEDEVDRLRSSLDFEFSRAEELEKARASAEAANRVKSEFLANMSHELRTPLNAVIGFAELLMDMDLEEEPYSYVNLLKQSGDGLLLLINNILDFSKIESKRIRLAKIGFDLRVLVEDVASLLAIQAEQKGLEMACLLDNDVPAQVVGDPQYIRQVLVNLVGNAIKFTHRGEVFIEVKRAAMDIEKGRVEPGFLEFSVTDTGIGIPPEKQAEIFERFSQAEASTTRRFGGTGLGLTISKELVEVMGGQLSVESVPDKGSRFWFRLDLALGKQQHREPAQAAGPVRIEGIRVLVADGNPTYRKIMQNMLAGMGCRTTTVPDGALALEALTRAFESNDGFDLLIMELSLAGMDGFELARAVHTDQRFKAVQKIVLTSMTRGRQANRMRKLGCRGYLTKPVRKAVLQEVIAAVLAGENGDRSATALVTKHSVAEKKFRNIHILIVDDYEINRRLVESFLKNDGYSIHAVDDGEKAVKAFRRGRCDLILMDMQMPGMDGITAAKKIRKIEIMEREIARGRPIPIVAMTADTSIEAREQCLASGMNAFILKPLRLKKLRTLIESQLSGSALTSGRLSASGDKGKSAGRTPNRDPVPIDLERALATAMGDAGFLKELLTMFIDTTSQQIGDIKISTAAGQTETTEKHAHKIKGAAANLDISGIRETASRLEQVARQHDLPGIERLAEKLEMQLEELTLFIDSKAQAL